jgi:hypothetical protein
MSASVNIYVPQIVKRRIMKTGKENGKKFSWSKQFGIFFVDSQYHIRSQFTYTNSKIV